MNKVQLRPIIVKNGRHRLTRPKTFASEDAANAYAKANGITSFKLENLRNELSSTKKIRIIEL